MKLLVERLIAPDAPGAVWGLTNIGPALVVTADGMRATIVFDTPGDLRDVCCDGLFVEGQARVAAHQAQHGAAVPVGATSRLVGTDGMPLGAPR